MKLQASISKDRAIPIFRKLSRYFNMLLKDEGNQGGVATAPFSARRQDLPSSGVAKLVRLIASREYGLY